MTNEAQAIERSRDGPVTKAAIVAGLAGLGVGSADRLLVHASLSSFGFVAGGAQAVVEALCDIVGPMGLIAMPAFTSHLSDPASWRAPPVPRSWWPAIREHAPAFDPATTPSRGIGAVCELLRSVPESVRGEHPQLSFVAWGEGAAQVAGDHPLQAWLGDASPLGRLYALDAKVLFLGAEFDSCTAFHLAEHRAGALAWKWDGAPVHRGGKRAWLEFEAPDYNTDGFAHVGAALEMRGVVSRRTIGASPCRLFSIRPAVDLAEQMFRDAV